MGWTAGVSLLSVCALLGCGSSSTGGAAPDGGAYDDGGRPQASHAFTLLGRSKNRLVRISDSDGAVTVVHDFGETQIVGASWLDKKTGRVYAVGNGDRAASLWSVSVAGPSSPVALGTLTGVAAKATDGVGLDGASNFYVLYDGLFYAFDITARRLSSSSGRVGSDLVDAIPSPTGSFFYGIRGNGELVRAAMDATTTTFLAPGGTIFRFVAMEQGGHITLSRMKHSESLELYDMDPSRDGTNAAGNENPRRIKSIAYSGWSESKVLEHRPAFDRARNRLHFILRDAGAPVLVSFDIEKASATEVPLAAGFEDVVLVRDMAP